MKLMARDGFTLLELMIVLLVLQVLLGLTVPAMQHVYRAQQMNQFFEQLEEDLYYAKALAMSRQTSVRIQFAPDQTYHMMQGMTVLESRKIPSFIEVDGALLEDRVTYTATGSVRKAGKLRILTEEKQYYMVFQIGRGVFDVRPIT